MKNFDEFSNMSVNDFFSEIRNFQQVVALISSKKQGCIGFGTENNGFNITAWSRNSSDESWNVVFKSKHEDFNMCFQQFLILFKEKTIDCIQVLDKSLEDKEDLKIKAINSAEQSFKKFVDNVEKQKLVLYTALKNE